MRAAHQPRQCAQRVHDLSGARDHGNDARHLRCRRHQVREDEALLIAQLAGGDRNRRCEHRPGVGERVELAILAARIDVRRQLRSSAASNSRPAKRPSSAFLSTQVMRARSPPRIISCASSRVGISQSGNNGSSPVPASLLSRYARISRKNRSPNTMASMPSATAARHASAMRDSYSSLEHGHGSSTARNGRPAAAACDSASVRRTACIATRSAVWLNVVSNPAIVTPLCAAELRITCKAQALSLPLDQESSARFTPSRECARRCAPCGSATHASRTERRHTTGQPASIRPKNGIAAT